MPVFSGNTSSGAVSTAFNNPVKIKSFNITPKSGGATINVSLLFGSTNILITPLDYSVSANQFYEDDKEILVPAGYVIYVLVSAECDYHFTLEEII